MITVAALLLTAFLFGGMLLYSFGFAAFVFTTLPAEQAGRLLREAFPHFYTWCIVTSVAAALSFYFVNPLSAGILFFCCSYNDPRATNANARHKQRDGLWE